MSLHLIPQGEFLEIAKCHLASKGDISKACVIANSSSKSQSVKTVFKEMISAGNTNDPSWAAALSEYRSASNTFIESLRSISVFDAIKPNMQRRPLNVRTAIFTATFRGAVTSEADFIPVTSGDIDGLLLEPHRADCIVIVSDELVLANTADSDAAISYELKKAVSAATNRFFISEILDGAQSFVSRDYSPQAIVNEISKLAAVVCVSAQSRPYLIVDVITATGLAFTVNNDGVLAFPDMTPAGGMISGIPVLVSDDLPNDSTGSYVVMLDAQAIAGGDYIVMLDAARYTSLQMDDAPDQSPSPMVSMFQTNSVALKASRYFGFELIRESGVAYLTGVNWGVRYDS